MNIYTRGKSNFYCNNKIDCDCFSKICSSIKTHPIIPIIFIALIILAIVLPITIRPSGKKAVNNTEIEFEFTTKNDSLFQFSLESSRNYETIIDGQISLYIIYTKAIYDIYTFNIRQPPSKEKQYYKYIYKTSIAVNSFCNILTIKADKNKCTLETLFDLHFMKENNYRRNNYYTYMILLKQFYQCV